MGIYLNPDNDSFRRAVRSEIYVDKTGLIAHTNRYLDMEQQFICVSRPRRFGKTMALGMLAAYYSCGCDSRKLFAGLEIENDQTFEGYLNQFEVICLNMQHFLISKPAFVVELKYNKSADAAIRQIREKRYVEALAGYSGEVLLVGINYDRDSGDKRHSCRIEKIMQNSVL